MEREKAAVFAKKAVEAGSVKSLCHTANRLPRLLLRVVNSNIFIDEFGHRGECCTTRKDRLLETAYVSLIGARKYNEDRASVFTHRDSYMLVLADGMGGHESGDRAAQCVIDEGQRAVSLVDRYSPSDLIQRVFGNAHLAIQELAPDLPDERQPRTTAACAVVKDGCVWWGHVGDSRVYHFRDDQVVHRTRDHSLVEAMFRSGQILQEEMRHHPKRNQVMRCLGGLHSPPEFTISGPHILESEDTILLCSDGIWEPITGEELALCLAHQPLQPSLLKLAEIAVHLQGGQADNSTAVALRCEK